MKEEIFTTDLFGKDVYKAKNIDGFSAVKKYSDQRFLPYIRIPIEYAVISGVIFLVLAVIIYAIGVERGKIVSQKNENAFVTGIKLSNNNFKTLPGQVNFSESDILPDNIKLFLEKENVGSSVSNTVTSNVQEKEASKTIKTQVKPDVNVAIIKDVPSKGAYVLQLVSTKIESKAKDELESIVKKYKTAKMVKKGVWYQIIIEGFNTEKEVETVKQFFRKKYPDCYILRRQK
ncbi:Sporulation/cell division region, bacteria domain protein [Candidatus Omnitrophus magneticus]|uniref:Sporulation/cell division region, bacteria domain protein n=1 Tax=Candidatus Omnitrophus magneticus TaxID=1609969 RepID=A0A0F0CKV6_9BACT|nr:Sporulation/cell division region, bacteria domain protein [Candidatus Omnitrophus magneticus]